MRARPQSGSRARQRGLTLVAAAAVSAMLGLFAASLYYGQAAASMASVREAQDDLLEQAHASVEAFASKYGRLPCPVATLGSAGGNTSSCALSKGWFPEDVANEFAPADLVAKLHGLRYYAHPSLSQVADIAPPNTNVAHIRNGHDLCRQLVLLQPSVQGAGEGLPGALPVGSTARGTTVYGIAAPGSGGFTGLNASDAATLEDPEKPQSVTYTDRVKLQDARGLARSQSCASINSSLQILQMAYDWNEEMPQIRKDATANFEFFDIWPLTNTVGVWTTVSTSILASIVAERELLVADLVATAAKDLALCATLPPACGAQSIVASEALTAKANAIAAAKEVPVLAARVALASTYLGLAKKRKDNYDNLVLYTDQSDVYSRVDKLGPQVCEWGKCK